MTGYQPFPGDSRLRRAWDWIVLVAYLVLFGASLVLIAEWLMR